MVERRKKGECTSLLHAMIGGRGEEEEERVYTLTAKGFIQY